MKIYLSHSSGYDYKAELYAPLKESLAQEHDIFFPHDEHEDGVDSKDIIANSDIVLAEVSYPSTGQGIELGWANRNRVPIICFYRSGAKVSSALRFISDRVIEYDNSTDMTEKLRQDLEGSRTV